MVSPFPSLALSLRGGIRDLTYDVHDVLYGSKGALRSYSLNGMVANLKQ
jgi:hypothetical protein